MIDQDLLEILACPETHQALAVAPKPMLERVNRWIAGGQATNRAGKAVSEALKEGLVRADQQVLYPVRDGIPVLLVDEGLSLVSAGNAAAR